MKKLLLTLSAMVCLAPSFAQVQVSRQEMHLPANEQEGVIEFEPGTALLTQHSEKKLQSLRQHLAEHPEVQMMRIESYVEETDSTGNQALSEARAMAVARWLVKAGIDCRRLIPVGFGDSRPIMAMKDKMNTRMQFTDVVSSGTAKTSRLATGFGTVAGNPCK